MPASRASRSCNGSRRRRKAIELEVGWGNAVGIERVLVDLALAYFLVALVVHLAEQLLGQLVNRRLHVARRFARTERMTFQPDGRLGNLVRRHGRILLDGE